MTKNLTRHTFTPMHKLASDHYLAGRISEALDVYNQLLKLDPTDAIALHGVGIVNLNNGKIKQAITAIEKAVSIDSQNSEYLLTLGIAHAMGNNQTFAKQFFREAVRLKPNNLNARYNFGLCLLDTGEPNLAIHEFQRILKKQTRNTDALLHLGIAYMKEGKFLKATQQLKKCLRFDPSNGNARINLGNAFQENGQFEKAISEYEIVLNKVPNDTDALYNLGLALKGLGKFDSAVTRFREVIEHRPDHIGALNNLGTTLEDPVNKDEALSVLEKAAKLVPEEYVIVYNLAKKQADFSEWEGAEINYRKVLEMAPTFEPANTNLANLMRDTGRLDEAIVIYQKLLSSTSCLSSTHSNYIANLNYLCDEDNDFIYQESLEWNRRHQAAKQNVFSVFKNEKAPDRRLKIGYVSPDFRQHSNNYFFGPLLAAHHSKNVETFCFSDNTYDDDTTKDLVREADHWRSILGMPDKKVGDLMREDGIDILVDLTGHMAQNRLTMFSLKPAPIQVTWLGYPNTTGVGAIDYRIADDITDPEGDFNNFHSEKIVRIPDGFLCYRPPEIPPKVYSPPSKENNYITFGSFNNLAKVTTTTLDIWAKCLHATSGSRLYLKALALSSPSTRERFYRNFENRGINRDRIELAPRVVSIEEHLSLYSKIDIALDTFPYNGTTTTFEALWMGVPVISLMGQRHASRVGTSILLRLNLNAFVAKNSSDFVKITTNLASNEFELIKLRHGLQTTLKDSCFFKYDYFASRMENSYRNMWLNWCNYNG